MTNHIKLLAYGVAIFLISLFLCINVTGLIGPRSYDVGYIITASCLLISTLSISTMILYSKLDDIQKTIEKKNS